MRKIVTINNKKYISNDFVDNNVKGILTLSKQRIAKRMFEDGEPVENISAAIKVDESIITAWWAMQIKTESYSESARNHKGCKRKVKAIDVTTGESLIYDSCIECADAIGCKGSTISSFAKSGKTLRKKFLIEYVD